MLRPLCVCGEGSGEPALACLMSGLGVRELSMSSVRTARVRYALRSILYCDAEEIAAKALAYGTPDEAGELLAQFRYGV